MRQRLASHVGFRFQIERLGSRAHRLDGRGAVGAERRHQIDNQLVGFLVRFRNLRRLHARAALRHDVRHLVHVRSDAVNQRFARPDSLARRQRIVERAVHKVGVLGIVQFRQADGVDFQITSHIFSVFKGLKNCFRSHVSDFRPVRKG